MPTPEVIAVTVQRVFAEGKLTGAPQVSIIRQSFPPTPGEWMMCLKGSTPESPLYAIYFQNSQLLLSRAAIVMDRCQTESYVPAPLTAQPTPPPDTKPRPAAKRG